LALEDDIRILSGVELFSDLSAEQLRLLAFGAEPARFARGQDLYHEGAVAETAYVIVEGSVTLYREIGDNAVAVARYGPGSILGELALIARTTRLTSAVADADVSAIRLKRQTFRRILEQYPELAADLHHRISADLQALVGRIESIAPRFAG
jgi:CRP-like cAMP-binding protein